MFCCLADFWACRFWTYFVCTKLATMSGSCLQCSLLLHFACPKRPYSVFFKIQIFVHFSAYVKSFLVSLFFLIFCQILSYIKCKQASSKALSFLFVYICGCGFPSVQNIHQNNVLSDYQTECRWFMSWFIYFCQQTCWALKIYKQD